MLPRKQQDNLEETDKSAIDAFAAFSKHLIIKSDYNWNVFLIIIEFFLFLLIICCSESLFV